MYGCPVTNLPIVKIFLNSLDYNKRNCYLPNSFLTITHPIFLLVPIHNTAIHYITHSKNQNLALNIGLIHL